MILHVFDNEFAYRGRVESFISMTWTEEYRGEGKFTLVTYDTDKYAEILRHGWFFYRQDRPCAMMAVKVERDTEKNTITVCGYTALHMLTRRIIDVSHEIENVEEGIYEIINDNLRGLSQVVTAKPKGLTAECEMEIEGTGLLDGVFQILEESDYGIRAVFDHENKRHVIEVYEGQDRRYNPETGGTVFSQEFGNLSHLVVTEDDDLYKNVAYVSGCASNSSDPIYYQYVADYAGDEENWREMLVDGENQEEDESRDEWRKRLKQIGKDALAERKNALCFEVSMPPEDFGKKFDLGDKVTCKTKRYGLQFDTLIMEYELEYRAGVETVTIVLGDRPLDYLQSSIVKSSGGSSAKPRGGGSPSGGTPGAAIDMTAFFDFVYPVGSIVELAVDTDPASLWGIGTWEPYMPGRVLVGAGTADSGTVYAAGKTGGEENHVLSTSEMPKHTHVETFPRSDTAVRPIGIGTAGQNTQSESATCYYFNEFTTTSYADNETTIKYRIETMSSGSGSAHNNMQPYGVVYRWLRVA